jgi:hypothetical protein
MLAVAGKAAMSAQPLFLLRKDIAVSQQFDGGATIGPTVIGDFNGDARPDIAVCTSRGTAVLMNSGSSNFAPPVRTSERCGTVTADFNGDGRTDLAAFDTVLISRGDGSFLPPRVVRPAGIGARVVVSGDFNGDRRPDLVFYTGSLDWEEDTRTPVAIHVLLGTPDGGFTQSWFVDNPAPAGPLGITITADFNGDARADLAVTDGAGGVLVFLGQGDGTFQTARRTVTGEDTAILVAGDFNRDGRTDIASYASIALGKGDGTFATPVRHPAAAGVVGPGIPVALSASAVADFDGDGHVDLAGTPFSLRRSARTRFGC